MLPAPYFYILFWYLLCLGCSSAPACAAANGNTLTVGEALIGGDKLVSSNGKFALGFFQTGSSKSSGNTTLPNWYLGIWFNKIPKFTVVWVANRDKPISQPSLNLKIKLTVSGDGNLVITNQITEFEIWSTQIVNKTKTSSNTTAVLLDNGNLVIQDALNPATIWWHSFEHPTDVFLPGAKIGRNKVTGKAYSFVSKRNSVDPAPGLYCMELDPSGSKQYYVKLCNSSMVYFSTGMWNGRYFQSVPEMLGSSFILGEVIDNDQEEYFTYNPSDDTVITFMLLDVSGLATQLLWVESLQDWETIYIQPKASCDVFAVCGPFTVCNDNGPTLCACMKGFSVKSPEDWNLGDRSGGCIRDTPLNCNGNISTKDLTDQFLPISSVGFPYNAHAMKAVVTVQECMEVCLSNCSCTAYSYSKGICLIWPGELLDIKQYNGTTGTNGDVIYLRLAADEQLQCWGSSGKRSMIIGVSVAASVFALILLVLVLLLIIWKNKWTLCCRPNKIKDGAGVLAFRYVDLHRATKNFSAKLGGGGFGNVFKGILSDSTTIAVKTLNGARQGEKQFRAEVSTIGMIQHVNLVKLIGLCCEGDRRMLVYEHMPNGSLDVHLFGTGGIVLNWSTRYQIAIGIAKGLSYLHENCRDCIIHCDVKPENILLDVSFTPKIADFGMAKLVGRDFSRVLTTMRGTVGYLAPEWISGVAITQKVDVYSYGMLLLEIISGRRNSLAEGTSNFDEANYFPVQAASKVIEGDVQSLLDHQLGGEADMHEVERACKVACWCIQEDEFDRPTMGDVVQVLEGLVELGTPPMPRLLQTILASSATSSTYTS